MAKKYNSNTVSVEWTFDLNKKLKENFSNRQWADGAQKIVDTLILKSIDDGISPVSGKRNFVKYKDKNKYPGKLKQSNKPNLNLTGEMLSFYKAKEGSSDISITLGIHDDATKEALIKAKANNLGTDRGVVARRFIPVNGEKYTTKIMLEIRKVLSYCLSQAINRGRNK